MKTHKVASWSLTAGLFAAGMVTSGLAGAQQAVLIAKPPPHNSLGQEAGNSADVAGDFTLMGSQMIGNRFQDSGGGYLFENGNTEPRQTFQLTGSVTIPYREYGIGPNATVFEGGATPCTLTSEQVKGAYMGDRVALSSQWVAMAGYNFGHNANSPHVLATCGGLSGTVPTVFLARRNASGAARPFGTLNYSFNVPFRERVQAMDVSDTDLVLVGDGGGAHIFSFNAGTNEWRFNRTALFTEWLNPQFGQIVSIDGDTIVIGDRDDREIYVYRKQGTTWSYLTSYTSPNDANFGRAVDVNSDLIAVGSDTGVHFLRLNGNTVTSINKIASAPVRYVAVNGEYGAGIEENQTDFIWQYHLESSTGEFYKSGTMGAVDQTWNASNLEMDGIRVVSGYRGYNQGGNQLIGSVIWDGVRPLFTGNTTIDNAEGERIWRNSGQFNWQRHHGSTPSSGTGPSGGAGGSANYYFVETSQGDGAYYSGQTAMLESDYVQAGSTLEFDFHMLGSNVGKLYVEKFSNGQWSTALTIDGQQSANRSANWQHRTVQLNNPSLARLRFRYVANGGYQGDVALDNIVVRRN